MSMESVEAFYAYLERMPEDKQKALSLKDNYPDQEKLIDVFIEFAEKRGFFFTDEEFVRYIFLHANSDFEQSQGL